ncbi:MAG: ABC transporter substrate-binding protein, partial [Candidatus Dormibacteria bacterium]
MAEGRRRATILAVALVPLLALAGCSADTAPAIMVGALFPLTGPQSAGAREEYLGIDIARRMVNEDGGVRGRPVTLVGRELDTRAIAPAAVEGLREERVPVIIGTYSSELSMPASAAASRAGITYWEAGAVADRVTGRGLPGVFRVGATGANLGASSGRFALEELAPRLARRPDQLRVSVVLEDDDYGRSVADAAIDTVRRQGAQVAGVSRYDAYHPDWSRVLSEVAAGRPDVLVLASYIGDGVSFRRAMLASGLHVGALIGSTMAECGPEFGAMLGPDAVGVFASDRPTAGFNAGVLNDGARAAHDRFTSLWEAGAGRPPTEEALAGFTAGWALFHDVMPGAPSLDAAGIAAAARATRLPRGALPNGAGIEF